MGRPPIKSHEELEAYKMAFDAAMTIYELSKKFPVEERYSLTDQIRRSSRSVCANLAEAWRKRRYQKRQGSGEQGARGKDSLVPCKEGLKHHYLFLRRIETFMYGVLPSAPCPLPLLLFVDEAAFVAKLNDSEAEAAETQTWLKFAVKCNYLDIEAGRKLYATYNRVLSILVSIINNPSPWIIKR